jgi:hypothetical protein
MCVVVDVVVVVVVMRESENQVEWWERGGWFYMNSWARHVGDKD